MPGTGATSPRLEAELTVERFVANVDGLFGQMDVLHRYSEKALAANLRALGLDRQTEVPVASYLLRLEDARAGRPDLTREEHFVRLLYHFRTIDWYS